MIWPKPGLAGCPRKARSRAAADVLLTTALKHAQDRKEASLNKRWLVYRTLWFDLSGEPVPSVKSNVLTLQWHDVGPLRIFSSILCSKILKEYGRLSSVLASLNRGLLSRFCRTTICTTHTDLYDRAAFDLPTPEQWLSAASVTAFVNPALLLLQIARGSGLPVT
jgi:hypothetical protein